MNLIKDIVQSENFLIFLFWSNIVITILLLVNIVMVQRHKRIYINFMKKIGKGNNVDELLKEYIKDVKEIKNDNKEIKAYYTQLDYNINSSIQKVGLVRYNAFKDVGSDLSFALALLDRENNGVVLNGLYGSESSNIYAKPIKNGESKYQLSEEEISAIEIAEQTKEFITKGNLRR